MRSGLCRHHVLRRRYYGHEEARAPGRKARALHLREARRLLQQYRNRAATSWALKAAAMVPDYRPSHDFTVYLTVAHELERLGARASPAEILQRAVAAHIALEAEGWKWPDVRAERQYLGRMVLGAVWQRGADNRLRLLPARVVSEAGRHVADLLGPYCRGLVRQAAKDAETLRAVVKRSANFTENENA